jgi:hypothetical protein
MKSGISMLCGGGKNSLSESTNGSQISNGKNIPKSHSYVGLKPKLKKVIGQLSLPTKNTSCIQNSNSI